MQFPKLISVLVIEQDYCIHLGHLGEQSMRHQFLIC